MTKFIDIFKADERGVIAIKNKATTNIYLTDYYNICQTLIQANQKTKL